MAGQDLKAISRQAIKLWDSNSTAFADQLLAANYQHHQEPGIAGSEDVVALNRGKAILASYHEDVLGSSYHRVGGPLISGASRTLDLTGWVRFLSNYHEAFSNSHADILSQIAEANMVATRWRVSADHTGQFAGIRPSKRRASWTGVTTHRFEGSAIAESWVNWDKFSFLEGVAPLRR